MAEHVRQLVRARVRDQVTGLTTTGANVFENRKDPLPPSSLPALNLTLGEESIERLSKDGRQRRYVEVNVDLVADAGEEASEAVEDIIDRMMAEVEQALWFHAPRANVTAVGFDATDTSFDAISWTFDQDDSGAWGPGLIKDIQPRALSENYDASGRKTTGQHRLVFLAEYHTREGAPASPLP
jgi:hypothetical protein